MGIEGREQKVSLMNKVVSLGVSFLFLSIGEDSWAFQMWDDRLWEVENLEGLLYGTWRSLKNRSLFGETELKTEKKTREIIRTSSLWKLFSRLNSNFQKPEVPPPDWQVFSKKIK